MAKTIAQQYEAAKVTCPCRTRRVHMLNIMHSIQTSELGVALDDEIARTLSQQFKVDPGSLFSPTGFYSPLGLCDTFIKKTYDVDSQSVEVSQLLLTTNSANGLSLCLHTWSWQGQFTVRFGNPFLR